ncbi:translation factor GTPase family protein [Blautia sp. MSJ-19]|uniref:translation factor GTPase family protein n=1 Tax=Blautia sp. MSJ-19 TaxID=2841517 RepID=UPI001C0F0471|nr:TetM/TetW/TetO/TetS family tetracycline resistance ribosomal protection protein [Blautia sp. MSJ-19]MBU5481290.1 TetM/TetW/TetO/TetS family tetracycline resistance ribosomal protection protein [Blautia sp. MSJ-19]
MKKLVIGILAHVDAGKTTLSEELLYLCGEIRKIGRVDHGDAFLDTYELEKERGITIFSKQALLKTENMEVTLLDTPGHVDFSAEMERTLQVLDYAILVINGMDGVQSHTMTLWRLLERYRIPTFLFVNKMDQQGTDHDALLNDLKHHLHENCVDFGRTQEDYEKTDSEDTDSGVYELTPEQMENIAVCEDDLLETYLETGIIEDREIARLIVERKIFPCYFGSALKEKGVKDFWNGMQKYTAEPERPAEFGAKVFKIARDEQGNRLTYMKITGGSLKVKTLLSSKAGGQSLPGRKAEDAAWEEKADQIRLYSGAKYELTPEAEAGVVCAVTGLTRTYPGEGLGIEQESELPVLEPVLNYQIILPDDCDPHQMLQKLRQLEEEEPQLHILWDSQLAEIHAQLMGEVQIEILKKMIGDRFHVAVEFGAGSIVYKETVAEPVEGVGHFEPLRHYAEVHLLIEPGEPGSGCQFFTACSEDVLARNWQRLILTHLEEKEHIGVLTGSPLTDVQITVLTGRAHAKHTEGGDFRQATYRAVRQGLRKARNILLEPYYEFRLEVPAEMIGRAMADIQKMQGTFEAPEVEGETAVLKGTAAVSQMRDYQKEVVSYTHGTGKLFCSLKGYAPCKDQDEIVQNIGYDPEADLENPTGSVFCAHGAGFVVPWDQVEDYMHLHSGVDMDELDSESWYEDVESAENPGTAVDNRAVSGNTGGKNGKFSYSGSYEEEEELQAIFERTFGPVKRDRGAFQKKTVHSSAPTTRYRAGKPRQEEYLLVDGYNIIFSWEELNELAKDNIHAACDKLMDILSNYQGYRKCTLILVFDAYKVEGHAEEIIPYHNIYVVYTKEAETADQYIEKTVHKIGRQYQVTVATSDGLEQVIIMGQGAHRISAQGLKKEIEDTENAARAEWHQRRQSSKTYLFDHMSEEMQEQMEKIRLGENK